MQKGLGQTEGRATTKTAGLPADIPFDFENAIHHVYGTEQGLPSNWIQAVLQTSDGFLWVGTHNGLARFDGVNFISYKRPMLPVNDIRALLESRDGTLWIGTTGGLAKYRRGCPGSFAQIAELAQQSIRVIFEDSSGRIWVGTNRKTWRSNGLTFEPVDEAPNGVNSIIEDGSNIWLGSEFGLYEDSGMVRNIPLADNVPKATRITQLLLDDGELLIGTDRGVMQIENDRVQFLRPKFGDEYINHIHKIGADSFVLGRQVYRRDNDGYKVVNPIHPRFIASDRDGGVWISGVRDGKLHHYQPQPFAQMFPLQPMRAIYEDHGTIWLGSDYYLNRVEHGQTTLFDIPGKVAHDAGIYSICGSLDNSLWLGTAQGLFKWSNENATPVLRCEGPVSCLLEDSKGTLWFAHGLKTQKWKDGELTTIEELTGHTAWFFEDEKGVWIGTHVGLFLATDQIKEVYDPAFTKINAVFTCHCADDGTLWMGTQCGLIRYRDGRFDVFTTLDGLLAEHIRQLQVDDQGNLWVGGLHGYFTVSVDQFDALLSGKIKRLACQTVEEDYGTSNLLTFEGSPSACRAKDGTTWIAAGNGVLKIPPQPIREPSAVAVYIDHVRVDGQTMDTNQPTFSSGKKRIEFDFAAPAFTGLAPVQYRLDGRDRAWLDAEDRRSVSYTDLRPGSYAFLVRSAGHQDSVHFTVNPRWWEMTWLRVGVLLFASAGVIGYFQYQLRRTRQSNAALQREISERERAEQSLRSSQYELQKMTNRLLAIQEEEGRRIARQLHDDISQRLSSLTLDAAAIERELQCGQGLPTSSLGKLQQKIVDIATDVHNISRRLHPKILEDLGLVKAVRRVPVHFSFGGNGN